MALLLCFFLVNFLGFFHRFLVQKSLSRVLNCLHLRRYADAADNFDVARIVTIPPRVLAEVVGEVRTDGSCKALWTCGELAYLLMLKVAQLLEVRMLQQL